jgi:hypothetical protein
VRDIVKRGVSKAHTLTWHILRMSRGRASLIDFPEMEWFDAAGTCRRPIVKQDFTDFLAAFCYTGSTQWFVTLLARSTSCLITAT